MRWASLSMLLILTALPGCGPQYSEKAQIGITYYCPGAGNVDFGDAGLRKGLEDAGYKGEVAAFVWTISFNPAIDQTLRLNAKLKARRLARIIEEYIDKYPGRPVNLVGLSAGTGIAVWALEAMRPQYKVDHVVLLSSSLWYKYDVSKALERVKDRMYVYYSPNDAVLAGPMKIFGSIDGVFGEDGAGSVGLQSKGAGGRVVNIRWNPAWEELGYYGGHVDSTSPDFVRAVLSKHLLSPSEVPPVTIANDESGASRSASATPVASSN